MAKANPHLRYSTLALSARQLERKDGSLPASMSLALDQEAIRRLLLKLHTKDIAVIVSCVVLLCTGNVQLYVLHSFIC